MGDVTALMMDTITDKSGHQIVPNAVSVCLTPAAPAPLPIPYPVIGMVAEGITDPPMRTKINGALIGTTGAVLKACHGNEPGTLKEVVSLNTGGPVFIIVGAPNIICELGMMGFTGSLCISNKAITVGAGGSASGAGGEAGGAGAGTGGSGDADSGDNPDAANGGGDGSDGTNEGASASPERPGQPYCPDPSLRATPGAIGHIEDMDLSNRLDQVIEHGNDTGLDAADAAIFQAEGRATTTQRQAFWSGGPAAMATARGANRTIQEDGGGAGALNDMNTAGTLGPSSEWNDEAAADTRFGAGSGITQERLWKTVSRRSALAADGEVDAFVTGRANEGNVFSRVELPTLLHNPNVHTINFRNPTPPPDDTHTWARGSDGCWRGPDVPPGAPAAPGARYPQVPGFRLDSLAGVHRFT